jgi:enamine deaminase RidA (YjgF/YER057c/UK114 family)
MAEPTTSSRTTQEARIVSSGGVSEIYISAVPLSAGPIEDQAQEICAGIGKVLRSYDAWVLEERVFATPLALPAVHAAREAAYGPRTLGVAPTTMATISGACGEIGGVQVHGVLGVQKPEVIALQNVPVGRLVRYGGQTCVSLSGILSPEAGEPGAQTARSFEKTAAILQQAGGTMLSVVRTWWWLKDICAWYDDFNKARRDFYAAHGLLSNGTQAQPRLPASTGIGMAPAGGGNCALDVMAVIGGSGKVEYHAGAGNQRSAYNYGSAFSRVARSRLPAGDAVFVSGTADIDPQGHSCHLGDAAGQILDTVENVRAVLRDMQCREDEVVQAIAYCKTPDVERVWNQARASLHWPVITVLADVCRDELLFELEATACPGMRRL